MEGLQALFTKISPLLAQNACIYSDKHLFYVSVIKQQCPHARHIQTKGEKSTVEGQGELKKGCKDPLFYINQPLAMLRANINRLIRKTWCTTKYIDRLRDHLAIYMSAHNSVLTKRKLSLINALGLMWLLIGWLTVSYFNLELFYNIKCLVRLWNKVIVNF